MSKTILVVEDYDDSRQLLKFYLETVGYNVIEAENGYDAIESVKRSVPDLILMDMSLPEIDGLSATRHIKEFTKRREIPVIAVTAHGHYFQDKAIEAGCEEVVAKPVNLKNLKETIQRYLKEE